MKILVIGGAGYIGTHIVDLLCDEGIKVVVFDNLSSGYQENLNKKAEFVKGDILNNKDLDLLFCLHKFDGLIHMAALKAANESKSKSQYYTEHNIIGSLNVISAAIKHNVNKIVFSSTAAVYGNPISNLVDESHPTEPINHYGFTKLYVENYLSWIQKISNLKYVALRYFNAAGYSEKKNLIKIKEKKPQNLLPIVMEVASGEREILEIYGNDYNTTDGTCVRDYINVLDLANAHIKALKYLEFNGSCSINLSTGIGHSVLDVVKVAKTITKRNIPYKFSDRRSGDPAILISSFSQAKEKLKWEPKNSNIEKIIETMWRYYK
tara:strand:+ start:34102 stop:35067 length:966 start_codon:yes stop_codon:yes gene_type:complete